MKINGTPANVIDVKRKISIEYKILRSSGGKTYSLDRGQESDKYECEFTFHGTRDHVTAIVATLDGLRDDSLECELYEMAENYFGMNIDHSGSISCVVSKIEPMRPAGLNAFDLVVSFIPTGITFYGDPVLP